MVQFPLRHDLRHVSSHTAQIFPVVHIHPHIQSHFVHFFCISYISYISYISSSFFVIFVVLVPPAGRRNILSLTTSSRHSQKGLLWYSLMVGLIYSLIAFRSPKYRFWWLHQKHKVTSELLLSISGRGIVRFSRLIASQNHMPSTHRSQCAKMDTSTFFLFDPPEPSYPYNGRPLSWNQDPEQQEVISPHFHWICGPRRVSHTLAKAKFQTSSSSLHRTWTKKT